MKPSDSNDSKQYRSVKIASLGNRRRGKHRDLTDGIMEQLEGLRAGMALEIPLDSVNGVDIADLRSAVHRAATAVNVGIETQSDEKNFYVWVRQELG
jgi:hypothetical protein